MDWGFCLCFWKLPGLKKLWIREQRPIVLNNYQWMDFTWLPVGKPLFTEGLSRRLSGLAGRVSPPGGIVRWDVFSREAGTQRGGAGVWEARVPEFGPGLTTCQPYNLDIFLTYHLLSLYSVLLSFLARITICYTLHSLWKYVLSVSPKCPEFVSWEQDLCLFWFLQYFQELQEFWAIIAHAHYIFV